MEKSEKEKSERVRKPMTPSPYTAVEKCRAVLSVWSERRKPAHVCRELSIKWNILELWQNRAMEGMLQALEPRVRLDRGPALSPRLQQLLEKRSVKPTPDTNRLEQRLARVQEGRGMKKEETAA